MGPNQVEFKLHKGSIYISWGCHNKVPRTEWLKTTEHYSFTVVETRRPKSRCQYDHAPSRGSPAKFFFPSLGFWWLLVFLGLWQHHSHLCLHLHTVFFYLGPCPKHPLLSLIKNLIIEFRVHPKSRIISSRDPYLTSEICKDSTCK